jgi:hypothetical protein
MRIKRTKDEIAKEHLRKRQLEKAVAGEKKNLMLKRTVNVGLGLSGITVTKLLDRF